MGRKPQVDNSSSAMHHQDRVAGAWSAATPYRRAQQLSRWDASEQFVHHIHTLSLFVVLCMRKMSFDQISAHVPAEAPANKPRLLLSAEGSPWMLSFRACVYKPYAMLCYVPPSL